MYEFVCMRVCGADPLSLNSVKDTVRPVRAARCVFYLTVPSNTFIYVFRCDVALCSLSAVSVRDCDAL